MEWTLIDDMGHDYRNAWIFHFEIQKERNEFCFIEFESTSTIRIFIFKLKRYDSIPIELIHDIAVVIWNFSYVPEKVVLSTAYLSTYIFHP